MSATKRVKGSSERESLKSFAHLVEVITESLCLHHKADKSEAEPFAITVVEEYPGFIPDETSRMPAKDYFELYHEAEVAMLMARQARVQFNKGHAQDFAPAKSPRLTADSAARKKLPIFSGVLKYFPAALAYVSTVSQIGQEQHNPGKPLFWDKTKSKDQLDALTRHLIDVAIEDLNGERLGNGTVYLLAQVAWRALAELQIRLEEKGEVKNDT